jgi:uncharacterized protein YbjT (DUF2867 family)
MRQPDTILRAFEGAEAVVSLVTAMAKTGDNNIQTIDNEGNSLLVEAAKRSGVKRFIFISVFGAAPNHSIDFFRIKHDMEEYIKSSCIAYTILRPTAFMETWCVRIGEQVLNDKKVIVWGDGKNPINFISVQDVAKFIVIALEDSNLCDQTLTIGGPQNLTFDEVIDVYERNIGRRSTRKYMPAAQLKMMSSFYDLFDETRARFLRMRHSLATSNWQVDMSETAKRFPLNLLSLDAYLEDFRNE